MGRVEYLEGLKGRGGGLVLVGRVEEDGFGELGVEEVAKGDWY